MFCSHYDAATVLTVPVNNVVPHWIKITFLDSCTFCIPAVSVLFQEGAVNGSCRLGEVRILNQNLDKDSLPVKFVCAFSKINRCTELWLCKCCSVSLSVFGVLTYSLIILLSLSSFYSPFYFPLFLSCFSHHDFFCLWLLYIKHHSVFVTNSQPHGRYWVKG